MMVSIVTVIGFVFIGITMEVIATSIMDYFTLRDPRMKGETYLWMVPIYAVVPYIYVFLTGVMTDLHWSVKGLVYMIAFYLLELIAGLLIKALVGVSPWNYEQKKYNLWGVICLDYAIVWYIYGIIGEEYYNFLIAI